jgi:hypothetical protein
MPPFTSIKNIKFVKTMNEKIKILNEAKAFAKKAKQTNKTDLKVTLKSGQTSSLGKVINTKEKADFFMKMLNAL